VSKIKDKEPNPDSESDSENTGKGLIIDADPTAIVATTIIQLEEPTNPQRGGVPFSFTDVGEGDPTAFYC
jgi:hypothetical protein